MLIAEYIPYLLRFNNTVRTSRAVMSDKLTYFIRVYSTDNPDNYAYGEVALFKGLSADDVSDFESILSRYCANINHIKLTDIRESAIRFGFETALSDLKNGCNMCPFSAEEISPISTNGLVWMSDANTMMNEAQAKIDAGFRCIKLKVGGIDFDEEVAIIKSIRQRFDSSVLEIRLDANGGFTAGNAMVRLEILSRFDIHSIEQPIKPNQWDVMRYLCENSPIPIALDEELIGMASLRAKIELLERVRPAFIILKPSLCGGFSEADEWISVAEKYNIGWWATSALESNIGLNAIARWVSTKRTTMPQGLGTGALYSNNIPSPILMQGDKLTYTFTTKWNLAVLPF